MRAVQKSVAHSNFEDAGLYVDAGLSLLDASSTRWTNNYELSLQLSNAGAEITYVFLTMTNWKSSPLKYLPTRHLSKTLSKATQLMYTPSGLDTGCSVRLRCLYLSLLCSLSSHSQSALTITEAIDEGLKVLEKLGELLPRTLGYTQLLWEQHRTKRQLAHCTDRRLLDLPAMTDPKKLAAMRLLNILVSYTFWSGDARAALITYRSIQMALEHGLSGMSGIVFVFLGGYLCLFGDIEEGNRYGQLSCRIVDRFHSKQ
jgi:hypothetical protein